MWKQEGPAKTRSDQAVKPWLLYKVVKKEYCTTFFDNGAPAAAVLQLAGLTKEDEEEEEEGRNEKRSRTKQTEVWM